MLSVVVVEGDRKINKDISEACASGKDVEVVGEALSGLETISLLMRRRPNVIVMTSNIPDLSVNNLISRIMKQYPTPILFLESGNEQSHEKPNKEKYGIVDSVFTPVRNNRRTINVSSINTRIHILSKLKIEKFKTQIEEGIKGTQRRRKKKINKPKLSTISRRKSKMKRRNRYTTSNLSYSGKNRSSRIIVIGTSTGGPRLLSTLIPKFPRNFPPVVVIQHMPVGFISAFAKRLDRLSAPNVKEAEDGESLMPGTVYLAPGGYHLEFRKVGTGIPKIKLTDGAPVNFVKPAVDITLKSAAELYYGGVVGVILTGMGSDGMKGSAVVKERDGIIICLNEEDSDVYGMNRSVIDAGYADEVLPKNKLVLGIIRAIEGKI